MRHARAVLGSVLLVAAGLAAGCKGSGTFVVVELHAGTATPGGIRSFDLDVTLAGRSTTATFNGEGGGDITLPTDATLQIGSGTGDLTIVAHARGASGQMLDMGTGHGTVTSGATTQITVQLGGTAGDGGAAGDGGTSNDGARSDGAGGTAGDGGGPSLPAVVTDRDSFDFGTVVTATSSSTTTVTVRNTGGMRTGALIAGVVDAVSFPTSADTCNGATLDPGASCTLAVRFAPDTAGHKMTTLRIGATPGGTASVALSGDAVDPGALTLAPALRHLGAVSQGQTSSELTFTLQNTGGAATTTLTAALTGSNANEFRLSSDGCSNSALAAGGTCVIGVTFAPPLTGAVGGKSATLSVSAATGGTATANVTGTALGPAALMVVPTDQDFGMVVRGLPSPEFLFTVTNAGGQVSGALASSVAPAGEFAISSSTCDGMTLAPTATCQVGIKMTPAGTGARSATLTIAGTPGGTVTAALRGTGLAPGMVVLSPSPKDFGTVDVGSMASAPFTVTNSGGTPTSALSVAVLGASELTLGGDLCSGNVLAAGAQCTFNVVFTPVTFGPRTGSVAVAASTGGAFSSALSATGRDYVILTVNKTGTGSGSVAASGLLCVAGVCAGSYPRTSATTFQTVDLSASPDALSTFTGWTGGGCSGTGGCTVTMDAAKTVRANFTIKTVQVTMTVLGMGSQTGTVVSDDGSISCSTSCGPLTHNAATTVTFTAKAGASSTFAGWASGPCQGTKPTCTIPLMSDVTLTATFGPQSYMFVTSSTVIPGRLGGVAGADTECANRATAAGLPGTYLAWISTTGVDAVGRVGSGGWVRTDGRPFAASAAALKTVPNQVVYYPPRVDENGVDLGPTRIVVATGSNNNGTNFGVQCANYTATTGSLYMGLAAAGTQAWSYNYLDSAGCASAAHLYCFRSDGTATVAPPAISGRRIFTSSAPFTPGGGTAAADLQCQADAKAAGISTFANFVALLATSTASAASRLDFTGLPWKRSDDVLVVASAGDLSKGNLLAPIDLPAGGLSGLTYASRSVWTGASDIGSAASDGLNCNDWKTATSTAAGSYFGYPDFGALPDWFNSGHLGCDIINNYLLCIEP